MASEIPLIDTSTSFSTSDNFWSVATGAAFFTQVTKLQRWARSLCARLTAVVSTHYRFLKLMLQSVTMV